MSEARDEKEQTGRCPKDNGYGVRCSWSKDHVGKHTFESNIDPATCLSFTDTKEEPILMSQSKVEKQITESVDRFIASLNWSYEATDEIKNLVIGNIRGFANILLPLLEQQDALTEEAHLLVCLNEESAEIQKAVDKALRFGLDDTYRANNELGLPKWDMTPRQEIIHELNDLWAITGLLSEIGVLPLHWLDNESVHKKRDKVIRLMGYARAQGTLEHYGHFDLQEQDGEIVPVERDAERTVVASFTEPQPIPMILHCPICHHQHIDQPESEAEYKTRILNSVIEHPAQDRAEAMAGVLFPFSERWSNPPHRSHKCAYCGCIWRPADVVTTGVAEIKTKGKADTL